MVAGRAMKRTAVLLGFLLASPALATPSGMLGTIHLGDYYCELPGDATGPAGHPVPAENFTIVNGSSYMTGQGGGAYLLIGDILTMTSGPKRGEKFSRLSNNFLRKLNADGTESTLRCVRRMRNNS